MHHIIALLIMLTGCGVFGKRTPHPQVEPTPTAQERYAEAIDRLESGFVENGFIVSRWDDGRPEHMGEAILWTGLAMAHMPCERGNRFERRLIEVMLDHGGGLVRFEPLGEYANGREITVDGALGLYYGVADRIARCNAADHWREPWRLHLAYLERHNGRLHVNARNYAVMPAEFTALRDAISHALGLRGKPHTDRIRILESQVTAWASGVVAQKAPAYRLNLGRLALQGLERLGYRIDGSAFCAVSEPARIANIEHWCGREGLSEFIEDFKFDTWEYRFQRGAWEQPDGKAGLSTPGLDLIEALSTYYYLSNEVQL